MAKKGQESNLRSGRFVNRAGNRWRNFMRDARAGSFDANRMARDTSDAVVDAIDLWMGLLGLGASPQVGVADFGPQRQITWKGGVDTTVLLGDVVDATAVFPTGAGGLQFKPVDGGGLPVQLQLMGVEILEDGLELKVSVKDVTPGMGSVGVGEYFANLYYTVPSGVTKQ